MITRAEIIDAMAKAMYLDQRAPMGDGPDRKRYEERWDSFPESHGTRIDYIRDAEIAFDAGLELFAQKVLCGLTKRPDLQPRAALMEVFEELRKQ